MKTERLGVRVEQGRVPLLQQVLTAGEEDRHLYQERQEEGDC